MNQATSADGVAITYDLRGRIASDGAQTYTYDNLNRIRAVDGIGTYVTDPLSRMYQEAVVGLPAVQFLYDGLQVVAEYATSGGALLKRYVPGPGVDELAGWYDAAGVQYRPITDERGSVIGDITPAGALLNGPLSYDEYGLPGSSNTERFQYTGQMRLRGTDLYSYKARVYDPSLGRFLQPDPIGYAAGLNLYAYVGGDPVNWTDPLGLQEEPATPVDDVVVTGSRRHWGCQDWAVVCFITRAVRQAIDGSRGHNYPAETKICSNANSLSSADRENIIRRAAYPGQSPFTVVPDRSTNLVTSEIFGPGGWVDTQIALDGQSAVNTTTWAHLLQGTTSRSFRERNGALFLVTRGVGTSNRFGGNAADRSIDGVNQFVGPILFNVNDVGIKTYVFAMHPDCR